MYHPEMTLRDYFAAIVLQSRLRNCEIANGPDYFAHGVYAIADAMIEQKARFEKGIKNHWQVSKDQ